jgi:hypothetical protein
LSPFAQKLRHYAFLNTSVNGHYSRNCVCGKKIPPGQIK